MADGKDKVVAITGGKHGADWMAALNAAVEALNVALAAVPQDATATLYFFDMSEGAPEDAEPQTLTGAECYAADVRYFREITAPDG